MTEKPKLVEAIIEGMQEKKANNIVFLDLRNTGNSTTDYFVVCHGDSNTQVQAITDSVIDVVKLECNEKPINLEGKSNAEWVLIDFFNVIVHVFYKDTRSFYDIESLWGDAKIETIEYQL